MTHEDSPLDLLTIHRRKLAYLEEQRTKFGLHTPFHIVDEIKETKRAIEQFMRYSYIYMPQRVVAEHKRPPKSQCAIILVSPEDIQPDQHISEQAAFAAIQYHRATLRLCWLIATSGERGSLSAARWLESYCHAEGIDATYWPINDESSVVETYNLVRWFHSVAEREHGLAAHEIVADLTGATKPMSIGLLLACQGRSPVQYMVRQPGQLWQRSQPLLLELALPIGPPTDPMGVA